MSDYKKDKPSPKLPGYNVGALLGSGTFGVVYRAVEVKTGKEVRVVAPCPCKFVGVSDLHDLVCFLHTGSTQKSQGGV